MMMINRRRIMGKKENSYIQDGLVFWFDGIWNKRVGVHDSEMTTMVDLTGSHNLTTYGALSYTDNYAVFDGTAYVQFTSDKILDIINKDSITIEMIFYAVDHGTANNNGYICLCSNVRGFWIWDNSYCSISSYSYRTNSHVGLTILRSAYSLFKLLFKGTNQKLSIKTVGRTDNKTTRNKDKVSNNLCYIGCLKDIGTCSKMKLYALRIYDRVLTQDELDINNAVDKERFKLNDAIFT